MGVERLERWDTLSETNYIHIFLTKSPYHRYTTTTAPYRRAQTQPAAQVPETLTNQRRELARGLKTDIYIAPRRVEPGYRAGKSLSAQTTHKYTLSHRGTFTTVTCSKILQIQVLVICRNSITLIGY